MSFSMDISGGSVLKVKYRPKPWRYAFRFNGKSITKSGFASRREALDAMQAKKDELLSLGGELKKIGFSNAYNIYLSDLEGSNTKANIANKTTQGKKYASFFKNVEVFRLTEIDIQKFKQQRKKAGTHSNQTIDHEIVTLKHFLKWCVSRGYATHNAAANVKKFNDDNRRGIVISNDEAKRLIEAADSDLKIRLLLALAYGLRHGEITNIKWADFTNGTIVIFRLKKRRVEKAVLQVPEDILNLVRDLPKSNGKRAEFVFRFKDCERSFKAAKKMAGLDPNVRFHDLRHTAASWQLQSGANIEAIRLFLGHADVSTTMRYLHVDDEQIQKMAESTLQALRR